MLGAVLSLLVAAVVVAQAPETRAPIAVVITSKRPGAEAYAVKMAQRVQEALRREGVTGMMDDAVASRELKAAGFSDPRSCDGGQSCVAKLAVLLGPRAVVVGVDVGKVGKSLAVHLEAMAADLPDALASTDISALADKWGDQAAVGITVFARAVKGKLGVKKVVAEVKPVDRPVDRPKNPPVDRPVDVPKVTKLEPKPTEPPVRLEREDEEGGGGRKVGAWALTGGAVVVAGAGVVCAVMGLGDKAKYDAALITTPEGLPGTTMTQPEAAALAGAANTKFTLALTSAVVSAALTGGAAYLFTRD